MCFHSVEDEIAWEKKHNRDKQRAFLRLTDRHGELIGSIPVNWADRQEIANVLRDLRTWHPGGEPNWSDVNKARRGAGLYIIDELELPKPKGRPSMNVTIRHGDVDGNHERLGRYLEKLSYANA